MKAKILKEHPDWKVSERRVRKYIKRHSKGLKLSDFDDESTAVSEGTKLKSFIKRLFMRKRRSSQMAPISVIEEVVLHPVSETDMEGGVDEPDVEARVISGGETGEEGEKIYENAYEEGTGSESKHDCECNVCIIS